jgi:hypothetical protein
MKIKYQFLHGRWNRKQKNVINFLPLNFVSYSVDNFTSPPVAFCCVRAFVSWGLVGSEGFSTGIQEKETPE